MSDNMEYITLRNSDLKVSRFCMGCCPMGGYGWGKVDEGDLVSSVRAALDIGVNFFDTADTYGLGQSERTLAKALGQNRKDVIIQTKFGVKAGHGATVYDNSPDYIDYAINESLKRLETDYIDIYTIHYRDGKTPIEDVIGKLEDLKKAGKIRYFGISNVRGEAIEELLPYKGAFVSCQDEFSLARREREGDLISMRDKMNATPLTWGSLGQGILTGKYNRGNVDFGSDDRRSRDVYVNFHGEKLERNLKIVDELKVIAESRNKSVAAVALRFILDYLEGSAVTVGIKKPSQIISDTGALGWALDSAEKETLNGISL